MIPNIRMYFSRPKWAGGQYEGDEHKRLEALDIAEELGADYIDIELKVDYWNKWMLFILKMCICDSILPVHFYIPICCFLLRV